MPPLSETDREFPGGLRPWEEIVDDHRDHALGVWDDAMTGCNPRDYKKLNALCRKLLKGEWVWHGETYKTGGEQATTLLVAIHLQLHPLEHTGWWEPDSYGGVGGVYSSAVRLAGGQLELWAL